MLFRTLFLSLMFFLTHANAIDFKTLRGAEAKNYETEIWDVCLEVYREYPYLYDGTGKNYSYYLESYGNTPDSTVILALDEEKVVGFITGIRMNNYTASHYKKPLSQAGYDLNQVFYVGDLLLLPEYRKKGHEETLYQELEKIARQDTHFKTLCFCEIAESGHEDLKPKGYQSNEAFWIKQGFTLHPELYFVTYYEVVNETQDSPHLMVYWIKNLS